MTTETNREAYKTNTYIYTLVMGIIDNAGLNGCLSIFSLWMYNRHQKQPNFVDDHLTTANMFLIGGVLYGGTAIANILCRFRK